MGHYPLSDGGMTKGREVQTGLRLHSSRNAERLALLLSAVRPSPVEQKHHIALL
jgi:hypothetical protein